MQIVTVRDIRTGPKKVWNKLKKVEDLVLTSNGKPIAIISSLADRDVEEVLVELKRVRAINAVFQMQKKSLETEKQKITLAEINKEIEEVRKEIQ